MAAGLSVAVLLAQLILEAYDRGEVLLFPDGRLLPRLATASKLVLQSQQVQGEEVRDAATKASPVSA